MFVVQYYALTVLEVGVIDILIDNQSSDEGTIAQYL